MNNKINIETLFFIREKSSKPRLITLKELIKIYYYLVNFLIRML